MKYLFIIFLFVNTGAFSQITITHIDSITNIDTDLPLIYVGLNPLQVYFNKKSDQFLLIENFKTKNISLTLTPSRKQTDLYYASNLVIIDPYSEWAKVLLYFFLILILIGLIIGFLSLIL